MSPPSGARWAGQADSDDCECICNHSGACTGCGICWLKAYYEHLDLAMRALFGMPGGLT